MKLVLIRHGQTDSNLTGALDTALPGADLNATGQAQAGALVEKWQRLIGRAPTILAHSPIGRAVQTAAPLAAHYGLETLSLPQFQEISAGELEMSVAPEHQQEYLYAVVDWAAGRRLDERLGGHENGHDVLQRIDAGVAKLLEKLPELGMSIASEPEPIIAVVVHGGMMRVWSANRAQGINADLIGQHPPVNTGLTVLQYVQPSQENDTPGSTPGSAGPGVAAQADGGNGAARPWQAILWSDKPMGEYEVVPGKPAQTAKDRYRLAPDTDSH